MLLYASPNLCNCMIISCTYFWAKAFFLLPNIIGMLKIQQLIRNKEWLIRRKPLLPKLNVIKFYASQILLLLTKNCLSAFYGTYKENCVFNTNWQVNSFLKLEQNSFSTDEASFVPAEIKQEPFNSLFFSWGKCYTLLKFRDPKIELYFRFR